MIIYKDVDNYKFQTRFNAIVYDLDLEGLRTRAVTVGGIEIVSLDSVRDFTLKHNAQTIVSEEYATRLDKKELERYIRYQLVHQLVDSLYKKWRYNENRIRRRLAW